MSDKVKAAIGLIIFGGLVALPFWYNAFSGASAAAPELEKASKAEQCIEPADYMRARHMELLESWRQSAVRENSRTYVATDGKEYEISITGSCLDCHTSKARFCDRCHSYAGVKPSCWECHVAPEETAKWK